VAGWECPLWVISRHMQRTTRCRLAAKSGHVPFHQVRSASNALTAVSALFPTLATAASISSVVLLSSSVVLLRRLRIRRAKSRVVMTTRLRGGFGRDEVAMPALRWINNEPQATLTFQPHSQKRKLSHLSAHKQTLAMRELCPLYPRKQTCVRCSRRCPLWAKSGHGELFNHLVGAGEHRRRYCEASAFAVLRLITSSYLFGAWTGRSPGFSPLRM